MNREETLFNIIAEKLTREETDVFPGKMMSPPGIQYKKKNFAFYYNGEMVFRLGKGFQPETMGVDKYQFLSPFKNKPPLTGWFQITAEYDNKWEDLSRKALAVMKSELK